MRQIREIPFNFSKTTSVEIYQRP